MLDYCSSAGSFGRQITKLCRTDEQYAFNQSVRESTPLAKILTELGVSVWYDEFSIKLGDSLSRSIDKGLANSKYGIVVLSKAFISKPWPEYELRGLISKEIGKDKVMLPVWHGVSKDDVLKFSPPLADKYALNTSQYDLTEVALKILEVVRPDIHENFLRTLLFRKLKDGAERKVVSANELVPGPIRHEELPANLIIRIRIIHRVLAKVLSISLESLIDSFKRDLHPTNEVEQWEKISAVFLEVTSAQDLPIEKQQDIFQLLLSLSLGAINYKKAHQFKHLTYEEVVEIIKLCTQVVQKPKEENQP